VNQLADLFCCIAGCGGSFGFPWRISKLCGVGKKMGWYTDDLNDFNFGFWEEKTQHISFTLFFAMATTFVFLTFKDTNLKSVRMSPLSSFIAH
jgi:hypothetical protein